MESVYSMVSVNVSTYLPVSLYLSIYLSRYISVRGVHPVREGGERQSGSNKKYGQVSFSYSEKSDQVL